MDNTVNVEELKKAPIASSCFMGLGQILYLKQYIRGALFAIVEIVMLCAIIFGTKKIIPQNNADYNYLKGIPETSEMIEYLESAGGYEKQIESIMSSRAKTLEKFFKITAVKGLGDFAYNQSLEESEADSYKKTDKETYKDLVAEAKDAKAEMIAYATETFADVDYSDLDAVEDAVSEIRDADEVSDRYDSVAGKFDHKLAKLMAKDAAKKFNSGKKEGMDAYKADIAQAKADYKEAKKTLKAKSKTSIAELKEKQKDELAQAKAEDKDRAEMRSLSIGHSHAISALDDELNESLIKARFDYNDAVAAAFDSAFGGLNEFDEHYDGCSLCKKATSKGIRTTKHRAWFNGPLVTSIAGLITLGSAQNTQLANFKEHSIFMMIDGVFALIIIGFFVLLYIINISGTKSAIKKIERNGRFPTLKEAQGDISQNSFATIGIAPSVVLIAIFSIIPLLFSALVAFTNYSSPDHIPPNNLVDWVGLSNFVTMFSTNVGGGEWAKAFGWTAIWTIVWAIFATFTCFFVGFFYAFVLQDKRIAIPSFYRTVYILPYAIPTMLSLFVWANLLNGTIGPINRTLQLIGLIDQPIPWLSNPNVAKFSLIFVNIWIGFPYSMILTTSSMTAISNSLYEAAVIDGATKWEQFKSITYPLVMFQLKPTLIMQFAGNINNFGAVFFLTGGGPNMPQPGLTTATNCGATDLLISWIYKLTMNTPQRYNLASVLSLLVFVVLVPFALYNFTRTKSFQEGEL